MELALWTKLLRKRLFLFALLILTLFTLVLIYETYNIRKVNQFNDAIDRAGLQRTLTNQTALFLLELQQAPSENIKQVLIAKINKNKQMLNNNLELLLNKKPYFNKLITNDMQRYYYSNNNKNYNHIQSFLTIINNVVNNQSYLNQLSRSSFNENLNELIFQITQVFDGAVKSLNKKMDDAVNARIKAEIMALVVFIIILILGYRFIYYPMASILSQREAELLKKIEATADEAEYIEDSFTRYQSLFNLSPSPMFVLDKHGEKFVDANPKICQLLGLEQNILLDKNFIDISTKYQANDIPSEEKLRHKLDTVKSKNEVSFEWTIVNADKFPIPCIVNFATITGKKSQYIEGVITDIAKRKLLEQNLIESYKKLEEANNAKLKFLAVMSHELRTPLNSILGYSEMLKDEMVGSLNNEQKNYLLDIHQSGFGLLAIINDILDFSKLSSSNAQLNIEPVDLKSLAQKCMTKIKGYPKANELSYKLTVPENLMPAHVDAQRIEQVLLNLLSNATKFTPAGGMIHLSMTQNEENITIECIDNGIGIASDKLDSIFEPFLQVDSHLTRQQGGSGLGLAIVKEIIELHHGQIEIDSINGEKTTVTITLPLEGNKH